MTKPTGAPKEDEQPDVAAEPEERATSKMSPFQLHDVLQRLAETPAERSQTRMRAPSVSPQDPAFDRVTVPAQIPAPIAPIAEPSVAPFTPPRSDVSAPTVLVAVVFVMLTCAVLFAR